VSGSSRTTSGLRPPPWGACRRSSGFSRPPSGSCPPRVVFDLPRPIAAKSRAIRGGSRPGGRRREQRDAAPHEGPSRRLDSPAL